MEVTSRQRGYILPPPARKWRRTARVTASRAKFAMLPGEVPRLERELEAESRARLRDSRMQQLSSLEWRQWRGPAFLGIVRGGGRRRVYVSARGEAESGRGICVRAR